MIYMSTNKKYFRPQKNDKMIVFTQMKVVKKIGESINFFLNLSFDFRLRERVNMKYSFLM